jgi:hypothetical protein
LLDRYDLAAAQSPFPHIQLERESIIHFNTGVIFFSKNERTERVFSRWISLSKLRKFNNDFEKDQYAFSLAIHQCEDLIHLTLPYTCNYRAGLPSPLPDKIHGPLYVWHSREPLPNRIEEYNKQFVGVGKVNFKCVDLKNLNT